MKEINLPKATTVRYYLDGEKPRSEKSKAAIGDELDAIEKNGLEIMLATIMIEDRIDLSPKLVPLLG